MNVFNPSHAYLDMQAHRHLPRTLWAGLRAMQACGELYLPREPGESQPNYEVRLRRSTLFNQFSRTIETAAGKVFSKPLRFVDLPPDLEPFLENCDQMGNHIDIFARDWFREALVDGLAFACVDVSRTTPPGQPVTVDDRKSGRVRPYVVMYKAGDVLETRFETVDGVPVLTRVRIRESRFVPDPANDYAEIFVERVRELRPGSYTVYERQADGDKVIATGSTGLSFIPFTCLMLGRRIAPMTAYPALANLATENLRHYQSQSDQNNILRIVRVPLLHLAGFDEVDDEGNKRTVVVGPNTLLESGEMGKAQYVEHSGAGVGSGFEDLRSIEERMNQMGMSLTVRQTTGDITATENNLVSSEAHSALGAMATSLQDSLELLLAYAAQAIGLPGDGGSVIVHKTFGSDGNSIVEAQLLTQARANRDITQLTFLRELKRRAILNEDFSPEDEVEAVGDEQPEPLIGSPLALNTAPADDDGDGE
ncbi:DUF4055 domain-containing protein [Skermanella mucosa]|uniref:DUF4055 domain-containing protein n=1 Tax=Skermanella mucosa TaxID=1789672 RepID=UPI00192BCF11|nr:DUF4055 domain-containing protein [Skermanella mucosa]UEM18965.1 DUF4055 domain-containing protein [Skermanella mucosa]